METRSITTAQILDLKHLPAFAAYILEHRLHEYVVRLLETSRAFNLPLLKLVAHLNEDELIELGKTTSTELLEFLAQNKAMEQIEHGVKTWMANELPVVGKMEITAEDINLLIYTRKKVLLDLIPEYSRDMDQLIELIKEIDLYHMYSEMASTNAYINILKENIDEKAHLVEKVNETIPGAVYVFDIQENKGIFSNNKLPEVIGYTQEQLNGSGDVLQHLVHPADRLAMKESQEKVLRAADGDIITYKYRFQMPDGNFAWLRNYESVFKRNEDGSVREKIGITLNIDKEQTIEAELVESEARYKEAEALTHIGNYIWDPVTNLIEWSDELFRIHELEPSKSKLTYDYITRFNHPDDVENTREELRKAFASKSPFDFYYRIVTQSGNIKVLHARGNMRFNEKGDIVAVIGTSQDVTEKQNLILSLREKENLYKQAEELANMGNWKWDMQSDKIEWTDQLYKIYGLEPQSEEITIDRFLSFVHPEDRDEINKGIKKLDHEDRVDYTFRIEAADGTTRILRSVAQVQRDEKGTALMVIGSERDITEKQNLIDKLRKSESLYKQAQALAHVGNWTWDIRANEIHWSEELYRIYGMEPDAGTLSYEKYISVVHPKDREKVQKQVEHSAKTGESWQFTHSLLHESGEERIIFATGEVINDESGQPVMMLGTAQDITERQKLIERLQESETLYKQAQNLAHIGNWSMDIASGNFTWSDEMYRIYELDPGEKMDIDRWLTYREPQDQKKIMDYYDECLREKKIYDMVERIIFPGGKYKMIHRKGEFVLDEEGNAVKLIGTTQDITEEYRIQQELKENQTFLRKITDATPSIISSYNINTGKYVFISEGIEKLLGYSPDEVMDLGVLFFKDIMHPEDAETIMRKNQEALDEANAEPEKNDMVVEFTYRMKHKQGHYRWFHTYGTIFDRNSDKKVEHVLNISLDVTEQVEASKKIKEQEHFIKQIADASPTILYLYDVEAQSIVYVNREIFFVLGYMPEEIINAGSGVTELLYHPEDYSLLPGRRQSGKTFSQVDSMIQYECRMKNKENEWRWLLVREIVFTTGENGKIKQVLGAALDINKRKDMEKTILQNTLLLEQSNASLEEFAYVASHDLKEPLRKISTFGDRLVASQGDSLSPDGKVYLNKIVDASQRMQTMINDLLSISMITGNTAFEKYSLQKIMEETIQTLEHKIEQQNAIIKADVLPEAHIIPSQFRQLFQNLFSNSLKFVKEGVQPVITVKHTLLSPQDISHFQLAQAENYHKIEISDNGIGFENEFANKIFAIFQRLHGRSEYEGSGIGLAICKKIVEHHGGMITASSKAGEGAMFTIILPAS